MCEEATGAGGAGGGGRDAEPKTRNPHKDVVKKCNLSHVLSLDAVILF